MGTNQSLTDYGLANRLNDCSIPAVFTGQFSPPQFAVTTFLLPRTMPIPCATRRLSTRSRLPPARWINSVQRRNLYTNSAIALQRFHIVYELIALDAFLSDNQQRVDETAWWLCRLPLNQAANCLSIPPFRLSFSRNRFLFFIQRTWVIGDLSVCLFDLLHSIFQSDRSLRQQPELNK